MIYRITGIVLGLLVSLITLASIAWLTFPAIAPALIAWQLRDAGWQLDDLVVERPVNSSLLIAHAKLGDESNNYQLSVENLVLHSHGMDLDNLELLVERMAININPSESTGNDQEIDLPALLDTYASSLPLPVQRGRIAQLRICFATTACQEGKLEWTSSKQLTQLSLQADGLRVDLNLADQLASLALAGNQQVPVNGNLEVRWSDRKSLQCKGQISIDAETGRQWLAPDLTDRLQSRPGLIALAFDLQLPLSGHGSGLTMARQLSGDLRLDSTGTWRWQDQELSMETMDPASVSIQLQPGITRLVTGRDTRVEAVIADTGTASFNIPAHLTCSLDTSTYNMDCTLPELSILSYLSKAQLTSTVGISDAAFKALAQPATESGFSSTYRLTGQLGLAMDGSVPVGNDELRFASGKPLFLLMELQTGVLKLSTDGFTVSGNLGQTASGLVAVTGPTACDLDLDSPSGHCSLGKLSIAASLPGEQFATTIELANTNLSTSAMNNLQLSTELAFSLTESGNQRVAMKGKLTLAGDELNLASKNLSLDQLIITQLDAHHNLATQSGGLTLDYKSKAGAFEEWFGFPVGGQLTLSQALQWQGPFGTDWAQWPVKNLTRVHASGLSADMEGTIFGGGQFDASFTGWPLLMTTTPAHLAWQTIDLGFPVHHAAMDFNLEIDPVTGSFKVRGVSAQAELLGGKVTSNSFSYDYPADQGLFLARLELLDLAQILALVEQDLNSSGQLIGTIPASYDKGHISVTGGSIESVTPGGFIRYKTNQPVANLASGNPQMDLVMKMLQDFHYDILKSDVDYSNKSILKLRTTLSGRNPAIENGRQINFNLNIEENMAALLESLQLSREVSDSVDKSLTGPKKRSKTPQSSKPREANDG